MRSESKARSTAPDRRRITPQGYSMSQCAGAFVHRAKRDEVVEGQLPVLHVDAMHIFDASNET